MINMIICTVVTQKIEKIDDKVKIRLKYLINN